MFDINLSSFIRKIIFTLLSIGALTACSHTDIYISDGEKISGPKEIAIQGPRSPWAIKIEHQLKRQGFKALRWASQYQTFEKESDDKTHLYNSAATRYVVRIEGTTHFGEANRCFGGGYKFNYIVVDLVDIAENKTLASYSGSGYSEGCPPLSGSIFRDAADTVNSQWVK
ncbi:hypothetical protein [Zhongshania sp.]|uniref:hypothetical protein n=1 Tax=Zhongshania sp. TaxID=1971902 RepID=UPI001B79AE37|nr:hypothetical protein [Zhongshania sp.]MBQ0796632.1 hypothetical protein [Zhongshania sp.]